MCAEPRFMRRLLEPAPALVPRAVGNAPIGMVLPESLQQCPTLLGDKIGLNLMQKEHLAARQQVALFDQSSFAKLCVQGKDATRALQWLCANQVDVPVGRTVYTGMLNDQGGYESDLTLVRQAKDVYYLVTSTAQGHHDAHWIRRHAPKDAQFTITEVTSSYGVLSVMGPQSIEFLQPLTDTDLSKEAFGFGIAREMTVGMVTVWALRLSYVGEWGWELHVPMDQMPCLYKTLMERSASPYPACGSICHSVLASRKGVPRLVCGIVSDDNPLQAGLGFAVDWEKPDGFKGREALMNHKARTMLDRRLMLFRLTDDQPMLWGGEIILRNGLPVGYTTSGAYGHTVGSAVAMGYVSNSGSNELKDQFLEGSFEIKAVQTATRLLQACDLLFVKPPASSQVRRIFPRSLGPRACQ